MRIFFIGPNIFRDHGVDSIHERAIINTLREFGLCVRVISVFYSKKPINALKNAIKDKDVLVPTIAPICLYPLAYAICGLLIGLLMIMLKLGNRKAYDVVYVRNPLVAVGVLFFKRCYGAPIIVKTPTLDSVELKDFYNCNKVAIAIAEKLEKIAFKKADLIFVSSPSLRKEIMGSEVSSEKVKLIPIGVDCSIFKLSKNEGEYALGYIGSYGSFQGIECLIRAMRFVRRKVPHAKLLLVGCRNNILKDLVDNLGLRNSVLFLNKVPHSEVPKIMDGINIFVIPRPKMKVNEIATPVKLLEALAAGKAIVATDVGGVNWIINNGENGLLVKPDDEVELSKAITKLLLNANLRYELSEAARKTALMYNWKTIVSKMLKEIEVLHSARKAEETIKARDGEGT